MLKHVQNFYVTNICIIFVHYFTQHKMNSLAVLEVKEQINKVNEIAQASMASSYEEQLNEYLDFANTLGQKIQELNQILERIDVIITKKFNQYTPAEKQELASELANLIVKSRELYQQIINRHEYKAIKTIVATYKTHIDMMSEIYFDLETAVKLQGDSEFNELIDGL